jgi:hypothetical protein
MRTREKLRLENSGGRIFPVGYWLNERAPVAAGSFKLFKLFILLEMLVNSSTKAKA